MEETQVRSQVRKIPWRRERQPTPVFLPGEFHGQSSRTGYSPWGHRVRYDGATFTPRVNSYQGAKIPHAMLHSVATKKNFFNGEENDYGALEPRDITGQSRVMLQPLHLSLGPYCCSVCPTVCHPGLQHDRPHCSSPSPSLPKFMSIASVTPSMLSPSPPALNLSQHQGLFQ